MVLAGDARERQRVPEEAAGGVLSGVHQKTMNFALKTMNFASKTMNFALKTMDFVSTTMDFALK